MKRFHLVSLGCAKNLVDSEVILGSMMNAGWQLVENPEEADVLLINTCGFIQDAVEEAIEEILVLAQIKAEYSTPEKKLVVVGCMVQRYQDQLVDELPEVDLFVGTEGPEQLPALVADLFDDHIQPGSIIVPPRYLMRSTSPRVVSTPFFRSWLKITEGCDNRCTYCMIPSIRGPLRSRSSEDLVAESLLLEEQGVKELSLVAQDSTAYGKDLSEVTLEKLLKELLAKTNIPWIRLLYLYPSGISDELLELMKGNSRILPYMDIPLQHVDDTVLAAMNRRYNHRDINLLLNRVKRAVPDIALRTTFLVGFPGETDAQYQEIERFLRNNCFDHVGVFAYANEDGVHAAKMKNQVPEQTRQERKDHLLNVQAQLSEHNIRKYLGQKLQVLVEGLSQETDLLLEGRSKYQAPEVDGVVYINDGEANPGEIVEVTITETTVYDLVGGIE